MRIVTLDLNSPRLSAVNTAACIGYFDGMHRGHQALIAETVRLAEKHGCESALITFDPDPWVRIRPDADVHHITTLKQRIELAVRYGIKNIFILNFTKEMSALSPEDFCARVLSMCSLKAVVCGFDFHFGYKGAGDPDTLRECCGCEVSVVDAVVEDGEKISSTRISGLIEEGRPDEAEKLMGHPFVIEGKVIAGRHVGTGLGFPTANVMAPEEYILPRQGVYAGYAEVKGKKYMAMINLGHNPTVNYTGRLSLEAHLLDFDEDIYGERIAVSFRYFLRPETDFASRGNLIMQLERDRINVRKRLNGEG